MGSENRDYMNKDILQDIFDALDNHIAIVDKAGTIVAVNEAWGKFGYANSVCGAFVNQDYLEICKKTHSQDMGVENAKASYEGIKAVLKGNLPSFNLEYFCNSSTGQRWYRMDVKPLANQSLAMISHLDITKRKLDEQRLHQVLDDTIEAQRKEYEAREIIELNSKLAQENSLTDMAQQLANWLVAKSGGIASGVLLLSGNPPLPRWMGSCGIPENIIASVNAAYREGRTEIVDRLIHAEDITLIKDVYTMIKGTHPDISNLLQTERVAWNTLLGIPFEYLKRRVGILIVCYHKDQVIPEHEIAFLKAVAKQSVYMLENARLVAENQDRTALDERSRLARELHDSVSQAIYGIALGVRSARDQLDKNPEMVAARLDYVHELAKAATTEMRALIFELRPESLEQEGLVGALRKLAVANEARHHLKVISEFCEEPDLPLDTKQALFRIVQEAIHNTVKHARAKQVKLCLCYEQNGLDLLIADDGIGFDVKASFHGHLGLSSMRERANLISAEFELVSQVGEGTTLRLRLPLSATSKVVRTIKS